MWKAIKDAPRDGTKIMGQDAKDKRVTWFGKDGRDLIRPVYGWCSDKGIWSPIVWEKIK